MQVLITSVLRLMSTFGGGFDTKLSSYVINLHVFGRTVFIQTVTTIPRHKRPSKTGMQQTLVFREGCKRVPQKAPTLEAAAGGNGQEGLPAEGCWQTLAGSGVTDTSLTDMGSQGLPAVAFSLWDFSKHLAYALHLCYCPAKRRRILLLHSNVLPLGWKSVTIL